MNNDSLDEKEVLEYARKNAMFINQYALEKLILKNLENGKTNKFIKNYTRDDVLTYLDNPERYEKELREISRILYNKSPQYRRTVNYFAKMPSLAYTIEPVGLDEKVMSNLDKLRKSYAKVVDFVEIMNIRHEFLKVLLVCFKEDVYYGYEFYNKESYFLMQLDPDYCTVSSIEDGVYNISFDFSFFDKNKEKLESFPPEFTQKYNKFKNRTEPQWQELDSTKTVCIKINEDMSYPIPPLAGTFISLYDLEDYKSARRLKEKIGSYMLLAQKLPMSKDGERVNDFLIDYETMMNFHNLAEQVLPEEIGMITSPMDIQAINFSNGTTDADNVGNAERDYWGGVGVSQLLFNTDKGSSIGLDKSVKVDEQIIFGILRQIERWINRRIKIEFKKLNFKINMLDMTEFNKETIFEQALKASQFGVPLKHVIGASMGMTPSSIVNMAYLENEVLKMNDIFVPLQSSHTASGEDEAGRPEADEVGEEGLKTRDQGKNDTRV